MNTADLAKLAAELGSDPHAIGYAAYLPGDPEKAVALLTSLTQSMAGPMSASRALEWAAQGPLAAIVDASNQQGHPLRSSCLALLMNVSAGRDIDLGSAPEQMMFKAWLDTGLITQEQ